MRRNRIAAVTLGVVTILGGLSWAGMTKAQQPRAETQPANRSELRTRLVKLRAEVDLNRAEHEAARSHLVDALKRSERLEFLKCSDHFTPIGLIDYHVWAITGSMDETVSRSQSIALARALGAGEELEKEAKASVPLDIKNAAVEFRTAIEQSKKQYVARSITLEEKSLELADLEKQYNGSK